ncbi:hypothetical protein GCM10027079_02420 [Sediminivirga luteola]|uniref:Uncharacterized protein n=1 Tax=Sediminivirga luteola TaxID=1774748 RepID=A0A8J2TX51_9MICO|nr:hypothetical protein GCM10011333_12220 [Sediminivirga luteola]
MLRPLLASTEDHVRSNESAGIAAGVPTHPMGALDACSPGVVDAVEQPTAAFDRIHQCAVLILDVQLALSNDATLGLGLTGYDGAGEGPCSATRGGTGLDDDLMPQPFGNGFSFGASHSCHGITLDAQLGVMA